MEQLTERQQEIKSRLDSGMQAREIAEDLGITRNAVYQQIQRMQKYGALASDYTPSGVPTRRKGMDLLERIIVPNGAHEDAVAGQRALVRELAQVRDELDAISRRLSQIVPR